MSKKEFKIVIEEEDSEIEDTGEDLDAALLEDEDLQTYLREMSLQNSKSQSQPQVSQQTASSVSQPSTPKREKSPERSASAPPPEIPPLSPARPRRSTSGGHTPPNVRRFRDPITGYPDPDKMAEASSGLEGLPPRVMAGVLTQEGRTGRNEVLRVNEGKKGRKTSLLASIPNVISVGKDARFLPPRTPKSVLEGSRRELQPQRTSDRNDPRVHQTIKKMKDDSHKTTIMPTGRMGFGDIGQYDLKEMRRQLQETQNPLDFDIPGLQHELPSQWRPKELAFSNRLRQLSPEDKERYTEFQAEANPNLMRNRGIDPRMVPRPTDAELREPNKKKVSKMLGSQGNRERMNRRERRVDLFQRSVLPSAINVHSTAKPMMRISENEEDPYRYHTFEADPETNLIKTTHSEDQRLKKAREEEKRKKAEETRQQLMQSAAQTQEQKEEQKKQSETKRGKALEGLYSTKEGREAYLQNVQKTAGSMSLAETKAFFLQQSSQLGSPAPKKSGASQPSIAPSTTQPAPQLGSGAPTIGGSDPFCTPWLPQTISTQRQGSAMPGLRAPFFKGVHKGPQSSTQSGSTPSGSKASSTLSRPPSPPKDDVVIDTEKTDDEEEDQKKQGDAS